MSLFKGANQHVVCLLHLFEVINRLSGELLAEAIAQMTASHFRLILLLVWLLNLFSLVLQEYCHCLLNLIAFAQSYRDLRE